MRNALTRRRVAIATAILLLFALCLWAFRPGKSVAKAKNLQQQLTNRELPQEKRRELQKEFRDVMSKLSPGDRGSLFDGRRREFQARLDSFFKMTKPEKRKFLDAEIDRMEAMRKRFAQNRPQQAQGGQGRQGGPRGPLTSEQREAARKQRLDRTTAEDRARMSEFFEQLNLRRQQRGLPAMGGRRLG